MKLQRKNLEKPLQIKGWGKCCVYIGKTNKPKPKLFQTNIKQKTNKAKKQGEFKGQYENALPALGGDDKKPKCKGKDLGNKDNFTGDIDYNQVL